MKKPDFKKIRVIQLLSQNRKPEAPLWLLAVMEQELSKPCRLTLQKKSRGTTTGTAWSFTRLEMDFDHELGARIHLSIAPDEDSRWTLFVALHEIAHINVGTHNEHNEIWLKEAMRLYRKYDLINWLAEVMQEPASIYRSYRTEEKAIIKASSRKAKRS